MASEGDRFSEALAREVREHMPASSYPERLLWGMSTWGHFSDLSGPHSGDRYEAELFDVAASVLDLRGPEAVESWYADGGDLPRVRWAVCMLDRHPTADPLVRRGELRIRR